MANFLKKLQIINYLKIFYTMKIAGLFFVYLINRKINAFS